MGQCANVPSERVDVKNLKVEDLRENPSMKRLAISIAFLCLLLSACTSAPTATLVPPPTRTAEATTTSTQVPTLAPSPIPSSMPVPTMTQTATPTRTATRTATPTPVPQTLGRIFPEQFHGQAVWSNAGGNADRNYKDAGWFCPPDGTRIECNDKVIHFDVSVPIGFGRDDPVLSPVNGYVYQIYDAGNGQSVWIMPEPGFTGIEALLANTKRIEALSKGIFTFNYKASDVKFVSLHLAHVIPSVKGGDRLKKGAPIANVFLNPRDNPKKMAFVIYVHMKDGRYYQFCPCDVPNEDEFCGKCTPGSPYPCP
jgi:hypothetical protein